MKTLGAPPATLGLRGLLRRGQLRVALVALLVVGLVLTLGAAVLLRLSQQHSLELLSRSIAYSVEAAVVFRDADNARTLLADLVEGERIVSARIELTDGRVLASHARSTASPLGQQLLELWSVRADAPVTSQGESVGHVLLQGDASMLLATMGWLLVSVLLGMLVTGWAVVRVSRHQLTLVEAPLRKMLEHTRGIRHSRAFDRRVPGAAVREIDELAGDFNALLAQVQAQEADLRARHAELQLAHEDLARRSRHDALTGAANRAYFEQRLTEAINRASREHEQLALLFIDADGFKQINDRLGHDAGDQVLSAIAHRLRAGLREHDVVGRLGGDEFVVLVQPLHDAAALPALIAHLETTVCHPLDLGPAGWVEPRISVGTAVFPRDGAGVATLMRHADESMYRRKRARRGPDAP
ncbi:sensor domain-containing diguanylate cyclase [Roseateles chitosanitabidus]|uniref:sensor domain-containing diguanylate cyclase n=1 Tax=Roseateles chitosanitabidus TaxID=65048 RepID=UPI00082F5D53|nr:sensor domain-containing diguanylate cyclase [Roseateles chitosanitabidus]